MLWCAFVDTTLPFDHVTGRVVAFNGQTQTAIIEWSAIKNRSCPGWRAGWMRESHLEPPPRLVEYLDRRKIPPPGFKGAPAPSGSIMTWRTDALIPASLDGQKLIYVAEWEFSCNPVQYLFPLTVDSPLVEIPAAHP